MPDDGVDVARSETVEHGEGAMVAHGGQAKKAQRILTADGGVVKQVYDADRVKSWSETITAAETRSLVTRKKISRSESASLSESWSKDATSDGPSSLTASWDSSACGMDLDWTADGVNDQKIYRCSGSSCDPQQNGAKIATVGPDENHYDDGDGPSTPPEEDSGDYTYQIVTSAGSTNTDTGTAGLCTN